MQTISKKAEQRINEIENQVFNVEKIQMVAGKLGRDGVIYDDPTFKNYGVYKTTGGRCLGIVGEWFEPTQPTYMLDVIKATAETCPDLDLSTLRFNERKQGSMYEFSVELKPLRFKNGAKKIDETKFRLTFSTAFDGSQSNKAALYTWRKICSNGMMGFGLETQLTARNTSNGQEKLVVYFNNIIEIIANINDYRTKLRKLHDIKITKAMREKYIEKVFKFKQENPSTRTLNKLQEINDCIDLEISRTGKNMFGLLQGITNWTNHESHDTTKDDFDEVENIMFNSNRRINDRAQAVAFEMIK